MGLSSEGMGKAQNVLRHVAFVASVRKLLLQVAGRFALQAQEGCAFV